MAHVGAAHARLEDDRFLTGRGRFVDDIRLPGEAFAAFVRSPHARARIGSIATGRARSMPGVLAVLTGEDWRRAAAATPTCSGTSLPRRHADEGRAPARLRRRRGAPRGRHRGPRRGRGCARGGGRGGGGRGRVGAPRLRHRPRGRGRRGSAAGARALRRQRLLRLAAGRCRGDGRRLRRRRPRHLAQAGQQPARALRHRAPRGHRRLRCGQRALHALVHHPEPASGAPVALARHPARARACDPGGGARCRRRLRAEDLPLPRGAEPALGCAAGGPAGALDRDPQPRRSRWTSTPATT